ncbi:MAG: bacillithiol system redox-active protein YtxJ [Candidatus Xenobiia bacterium LiM19]
MLKECRTTEDFEKLLERSGSKPCMLLKHSTSCPISRMAHQAFISYADSSDCAECWKVLVIEVSPVSLHIAEKTGIRHQSPQAILFVKGKPVWNASHYSITEENLLKACTPYLAR